MASWRLSRSVRAPSWNFSSVARARFRNASLLLLQRVGGERLERVGKPGLGVAQHLLLFQRGLALLLQPRLHGGDFLPQAGEFALRRAVERELVRQPRFQFGDPHVARAEPFLQRGGLRAQHQPRGQRAPPAPRRSARGPIPCTPLTESPPGASCFCRLAQLSPRDSVQHALRLGATLNWRSRARTRPPAPAAPVAPTTMPTASAFSNQRGWISASLSTR